MASSAFIALSLVPAAAPDPVALAQVYVGAVEKLNEAHARKPQDEDEAALSKKLPKEAAKALDTLVTMKAGDSGAALVHCGEAALDLDRVDDFERIRAALVDVSPEKARALGIVLSKPRYILRGTDGVEKEGLEALSGVLDEVLAAYDDVFGFAEWSKVPGKKLRIRAHLVSVIQKPPHFAPEFPYHSEIDFPVVDARGFSSPTKDGKFLLYGLCHELGHVIAMWGDRDDEEDKHQWAHYTGITIVEHLALERKSAPALAQSKDVKWRSLEIERKQLAAEHVQAGNGTADGVLALLVAVHDLVGPKSIGEAINALDREDKRLRVNKVRYYRLDAFAKALAATPVGKQHVKELAALFP